MRLRGRGPIRQADHQVGLIALLTNESVEHEAAGEASALPRTHAKRARHGSAEAAQGLVRTAIADHVEPLDDAGQRIPPQLDLHPDKGEPDSREEAEVGQNRGP